MNENSIFVDELIWENTQLAVQHEADRQTILRLSERAEQLEVKAPNAREAAQNNTMAQAGIVDTS